MPHLTHMRSNVSHLGLALRGGASDSMVMVMVIPDRYFSRVLASKFLVVYSLEVSYQPIRRSGITVVSFEVLRLEGINPSMIKRCSTSQ